MNRHAAFGTVAFLVLAVLTGSAAAQALNGTQLVVNGNSPNAIGGLPGGQGPTLLGGFLHVTGDAQIDGNIAAKYQEVAEWVRSEGTLPAGTVVIIDSGDSDRVTVSKNAYDERVAGVVSRKPGILLGEG